MGTGALPGEPDSAGDAEAKTYFPCSILTLLSSGYGPHTGFSANFRH